MRATLAALLALVPLSLAHAESYGYTGNVGSKAAYLTIEWPKGSSKKAGWFITGNYSVNDTGKTYQLRGQNPRQGRLILEEYTGDKRTATIRLKKSKVKGKITWSGTMVNTDGRKIPVKFSPDNEDCGC
jgi:hypothetical protein